MAQRYQSTARLAHTLYGLFEPVDIEINLYVRIWVS